MKELRGHIIAVLEMLCHPSVGLLASKSEKMQTKHQVVCKHTRQIHRSIKSYSCSLSAPSGLDTSRDMKSLLSL